MQTFYGMVFLQPSVKGEIYMTDEKKPYFTYKDRVFRLLFKDRKRLLELYNALNDTHYTDVENLTVTTLENAIYMKMKNDVSFVIDCSMCLYNHSSGIQSSSEDVRTWMIFILMFPWIDYRL